jgi:uncharacterized protein
VSSSVRLVRALEPITTLDAQPFWEGVLAGELRLQQCPDTGRLIFPPTPTSPFGTHRPPLWTTVAGRGRIWSFIVPYPPLIGQFAEASPYVTVLVELDADPSVRLPGALVASPGAPIGSASPLTVAIGQPVAIDMPQPIDGRAGAPRWVPIQE